MKSTLLLAAALAGGAVSASAQEGRPLDLRVPIERAQAPAEDPANPHARRRWNAAQDDDHHARRRWNAANPPGPEARAQRPEPSRPAVQRQAAGAAGGGNRGR